MGGGTPIAMQGKEGGGGWGLNDQDFRSAVLVLKCYRLNTGSMNLDLRAAPI